MKKILQLTVLTSALTVCATNVGADIAYQYDGLNRLVQVTYDDQSAVWYDYDAVGNRTVRVTNTDPDSVYLFVQVDPPASGTVSRAPDLTWYPVDSQVVLTAEAEGVGQFVSWGGDVPPGQELDNPLTLTLDGYKSLTAHFSPCPACPGDLDGDGVRNVTDFTLFASAFGSQLGDPDYDPCADLNGDGFVNVTDFTQFAPVFGVPCP